MLCPWEQHLEPAVWLCRYDAAKGDPLGGGKLSPQVGLHGGGWRVLKAVHNCRLCMSHTKN